jgi:ParB family chromosome partitioning protein
VSSDQTERSLTGRPVRQEASVEALVENIRREELNAVDRARALARLRTTLDPGSWQQVAALVGITRQHLYNILNVTRLPEPMRDDIRAGALTEKHARALLRLRDQPEQQRRLWEEIRALQLSGRAAEERARAMAPSARSRRGPAATTPPAPPPGRQPAPDDLLTLATELLVALVTASPDRLRAAAPALSDLHRRLGQVLDVTPAPARDARGRRADAT